ncbi:hypothetical protein HTZ77_01210 [Nonomuraea sp. SMC257]|uniref:Uncharacterized protein n=1 Tax=Nonomuraea montanisoli TaxID=2741721 RepID=A0A7Y6I3H0_9ACTN|nr:hypothetical protein [Nonomuraea montanisoli]NUW30055.1 hypothetical protein [Nonomuraea montanisoli]
MAATKTVIMPAVQESIVTSCHHIWFDIVTPDDIWKQLGIASWHAYRVRLQIVVHCCLASLVMAAGLWWTGAMTPHIRWGVDTLFTRADVDANGVLYGDVDIEVENEGWATFTLTGISADIPGLRFLPPDEGRQEPATLTARRGDMEVLRRRVVITDCAAVPHEPRPIRFTYRTWLGGGSAEVIWDSGRLDGPSKSLPIAWQRGLAGKICNEAVSPAW